MIDEDIKKILELCMDEQDLVVLKTKLRAFSDDSLLLWKLLSVVSVAYNAGFDNGWDSYAMRYEE